MKIKINIINKILGATAFTVALFATMSFVPISPSETKTNLTIRFQNYAGGNLLKLDAANFKNEAGQAYTISKFKYYVGNIRLKKADGSEYRSNEYFLIDQENPASTEISLTDVPEGAYTSINFLLGVDSLHNCSGAQSGALDPMNGMFWAWNTGYIFLKIEGHSPASKSPGHIYEFHVGGYKAPSNCIRKIALSFKNQQLQTSAGKKSSVSIKADASAIFNSPFAIDFSKMSSVTDFHNATLVADNYARIFSILAIE